MCVFLIKVRAYLRSGGQRGWQEVSDRKHIVPPLFWTDSFLLLSLFAAPPPRLPTRTSSPPRSLMQSLSLSLSVTHPSVSSCWPLFLLKVPSDIFHFATAAPQCVVQEAPAAEQ